MSGKVYEFQEFESKEILAKIICEANTQKEIEAKRRQEQKEAEKRKLREERERRELKLMKRAVMEVAEEQQMVEKAVVMNSGCSESSSGIPDGVVKRVCSENQSKQSFRTHEMGRETQLGALLQKWFPQLKALSIEEIEWKMLDYIERSDKHE